MAARKQNMEMLFENFYTIKRKLIEERFSQKSMEITPSQGLILHIIFKNEGLGVKKIADTLHISSSAATQLIDGLVEKKYLIREPDKKDRRALKIKLSGKAKQEINFIREKNARRLARLFQVLTDEELEQYAKLNNKIASAF